MTLVCGWVGAVQTDNVRGGVGREETQQRRVPEALFVGGPSVSRHVRPVRIVDTLQGMVYELKPRPWKTAAAENGCLAFAMLCMSQ